ncbi:CYTH and CHAD domain-containing protein [Sinomonas gamaensis]|uniref:CYTH and CHAD domain-containing protein n=1 Tax=Sinomonas gamaensis TaxID=2565624 RepID=UPI0011094695|nr:CYTH and CHAD domain-containing protein [Sinomonas gamaensis]
MSVESERKFEIPGDAPAPPVESLPGVHGAGPGAVHRLEAVYFDTARLSLAARGITLRRRTGGKDAGWHLKLPLGPDKRIEVTEPLGSDAEKVPARLREMVAAHVRSRSLEPVAKVETVRRSTPLVGEGNSVLAEFSDDRVEAWSLLNAGAPLQWRELEIELENGPVNLLDAAERLVGSHGGHRSAYTSKLARALGDSYPRARTPSSPPRRKGPAAEVLLAYLRRQIEALLRLDPRVRMGEPRAVHQMRIAARRMRSTLATFRKYTDRDAADYLREELKWVAQSIGEARDLEVMRERLERAAAAEPPELLMGPVVQRIDEELGARHHRAHASSLEALGGERYFALLDALEAFVEDPPLTDAGRRRARKAVARRVSHLDRLREAVAAAQDATGTPESDPALHEARKCAKRLRYAAESARPVHGKLAKRLAKDVKRIQTILGDHQDSVVTRSLLRELGTSAYLEGANAFSFGRLHANEQQRAAEARAEFWRYWEHFNPKPLH